MEIINQSKNKTIVKYDNSIFERTSQTQKIYWLCVNYPTDLFIIESPYKYELEKEYQKLIRSLKLNNILNENY